MHPPTPPGPAAQPLSQSAPASPASSGLSARRTDPHASGYVPVGSSRPSLNAFMAMQPAELLTRYRVGVENFDRRLFDLSHADLDTSFREDSGVGRWSCRVLVGHLADAELSFVHRMRRIVAEDAPLLAPWDENAFIDCQKLYGVPATGENYPIGAFVAAIHSLRMWTGQWLATLDQPAWARKGLHPQRGEQTLATVLTYSTWHVEHHAWFLNRKIARLRAEPVPA